MVFENFVDLLIIVTTVTGTAMSCANFLQAHKIWKRKCADDVSVQLFEVLFAGAAIWLLYGLSISSYPIVIANAVGMIATGTVVALCFKYNKVKTI